MLFYGDKDSPAFDQFQSGIRNKLEHELDAPVWIYAETFDEAWLGQSPTYALMMEQFLRAKYGKRGIGVVVPVGDYPIQFMRERHKRLLPDAKIVWISFGVAPRLAAPDSTGIAMRTNLGPTVELALLQNPGTRHILLIAGATAVDRVFGQLAFNEAMKYIQEKHKAVDLRILSPGTFAESKAALAALPPDTVSVMVTYFGDSVGQGFVSARILPTFSAATNCPMYGWNSVNLGRGIVGGSMVDMEENGGLLGSLMARVIRGEDPGSIPIAKGDLAHSAFDWKQLKRWGIPMDRVPEGSIVINREFTFWELYKWRVIGLISLVFLEAMLIGILIRLAFLQRRHVRQLAERRKTEALLAQIAAALIFLPPELVNKEIENSFQRVLESFDLDQINLFEFSPGTTKLRLLCSRSSTGSMQPPAVVDLHQLPWTAARLLGGAPILLKSLAELPSEAGPLKEILNANQILSFASFPLMHKAGLFGTLSFSTICGERAWEPNAIYALEAIARIFGSALDRKRAEEAAQESQQRLTGIVESAMDAVIAVDADQRIVVFNTTAERMFGCPAGEALGSTIERFIPNRFRTSHRENILRFAASEETNRGMGRLGTIMALRANGREFPIEASISQVQTGGGNLFTAIIRDTTERERAERQLRESYELNLSILQSLKNHLAVLDSKGTIIAVTARGPEFVAVSGINLHELHVGDNYLETRRAAADAGDRDVATALEGVKAVYDGTRKYFELQYDYKSGIEQRWFLMSATPMKDRSVGVIISHEDITVRKRHEQAIQELSGRLINVQEQERSRIARELHDDINQQVAMLAIELQQLRAFFPKESPETDEKVNSLWKKTHALSTDIQQLSHRLHSTKLEHLGIVAALRGLCNEVSAQGKIEIEFQFQQVPAEIGSGVSLSIFRVAQESLHNVAKHSHAEKVRMELFGTGGSVVLRVSDDGVGFDPEAPENTTGLGMVSMGERIRLEGGTFSVTSKPSLGTQIEARIPLVRGIAAAGTAHSSTA